MSAPYNRISNAQIAANRRAHFYMLESLRTGMNISEIPRSQSGSQRVTRAARGRSRGGGRKSGGLLSGSPHAPPEIQRGFEDLF